MRLGYRPVTWALSRDTASGARSPGPSPGVSQTDNATRAVFVVVVVVVTHCIILSHRPSRRPPGQRAVSSTGTISRTKFTGCGDAA